MIPATCAADEYNRIFRVLECFTNRLQCTCDNYSSVVQFNRFFMTCNAGDNFLLLLKFIENHYVVPVAGLHSSAPSVWLNDLTEEELKQSIISQHRLQAYFETLMHPFSLTLSDVNKTASNDEKSARKFLEVLAFVFS